MPPSRWRKRSSKELVKQAYPLEPNVEGPNGTTVEFFGSTGSRAHAELGVYKRGYTAAHIAEQLAGEGRATPLRLRGPARGGRRSREGHRPYE